MDFDFTGIIDCVRRGQVVRIAGGQGASDTQSAAAPYLMLSAQRATPEALALLVELSGVPPVFATTRDRLESLQIAGVPFTEDDEIGGESASGNGHHVAVAAPSAVRLARAAASLASADPQLAQAALEGLTIRCIDWGGAVNCQRVFEAAVDLTRLAGLSPAAVMARVGPHALASATGDRLESLPGVLIRDVVDHRRGRVAGSLQRSGPRVRMPTRHGNFTLQAYEDRLTGQLHLALWTGGLEGSVLVRVHSECLTGDLLGSLRCDCGPQLDLALERLAAEGSGVLLYLRQEGRGIGLINKLRTYAIQDRGFDTVEANEQIGFGADLRDYNLAAEMLVDLGVSTIRLLTNNPQKVRGLKKHGISVEARVPLVVESCSENKSYLDVKRKKLGHWLS
jgi:3,4-dihydroxy 2-butanone 4-phosphate synthase / GTP cyclohydrolase II